MRRMSRRVAWSGMKQGGSRDRPAGVERVVMWGNVEWDGRGRQNR